MKGNVFSEWLKEFCALVFTQTVQAFILAIILTLVITALFTDSSYTSVTQNQAAGVLAIIALTSISKMEGLVKKIFGLNSSITDASMKGGKGGLLGTVAAISMAKKALNNVPKMGKGISGSLKARKDRRQAEIDATNKLRKLNARYGVGGEGTSTNSNSTNNGSSSSTSTNNPPSSTSSNQTQNNNPNSGGGNSNSTSSTSASTQSSNSSSKRNDDKYEDKKEKIMEEYAKKIADAKKLSKESRKQFLSGALETKGAVLGAAMGAVVGAGTGDDILKTMGTGIGVGDMLGKATVDAAYAPFDIKKEIDDYMKTTKKYRKQETQRMINEFRAEYDRFTAGDID